MTNRLSVVGVGASAGGLDAFSRLLKAMPVDTGMAFVLVQHLAPQIDSHLVDLLQRTTSMHVAEALDGQVVEPNCVYAIPHNRLLTITNNRFHLDVRPDERGPFLPIDAFLMSLAVDSGSQAIGVLLSGNGSDGTLGMQAIKAEGGVTFAQDSSAQHGEMPQCAILSGSADFVLPPEQIAVEICRIGQHQLLCDNDPDGPRSSNHLTNEDLLAALFRRLHRATGTAFADYKRTTTLRRIQRRLLVNRIDELAEYLEFIDAHPEELELLHRDLLIHVTSFFRDPGVFEALRTTIMPKLVKNRSLNSPIRVWVAGCATGEEAYSLAICLREIFDGDAAAPPIKIFATDVSESAIKKARTGRYASGIEADVSPERLRRFFVRWDGGYEISKEIRDLCVFACHDITRDPPFSNLDLISCRNVMIYFSASLQKRIWPIFHYALADQGYLLLGNSEMIGSLLDQFAVADAQCKIYSKCNYRGRIPGEPLRSDTSIKLGFPSSPSTREAVNDQELLREVDRRLSSRYAPSGVVVDEQLQVVQFRGDTGRFLTPAPGIASLNLYKMAREGMLLDLRAAVDEARHTHAVARREGVKIRSNDEYIEIDVQVIPVVMATRRCFAVLFEESSRRLALGDDRRASALNDMSSSLRDATTVALQQELQATKEVMQSIIDDHEASCEELRAANEEILSSYEELQSTNEELQTAKEELQATNEELNTVNEELLQRNSEATQLSDDLNNLVRSVNIPIVIVGQDLRIRRFTPSASEVFSLIASDVGRPIADMRPKFDNVDLRKLIVEVLETLTQRTVDTLGPAGRWYRLAIQPYRAQGDRIDGAVVSVQDIDAIKQSELNAGRSRQLAEDILNSIPFPVAVLDGDLRVTSANARLVELFHSGSEPVVGRSIRSLDERCGDVNGLLLRLQQTYAQGTPFDGWELSLGVSAENHRTMLVSGRRMVFPGQDAPRLVVCLEDVTDRMKLEMQLRHSQKMEAVGRLAAGVAHDFNNALSIVRMSGELLAKAVSIDSETQGLVANVLKATRRAAQLTQQLLAFSSTVIVHPGAIDLNRVVTTLESIVRPLLGESVTLQLDLAPNLATVNADPTLVEQMILNLVLNARDAMPDGGLLLMATANEEVPESRVAGHGHCVAGPYVRLTVHDNGCGMDAATLSHIFEPFFTTKEFGRNFGLGLASVYGSVRQSGGFIDVSSQPSCGTSLRIYLPVVTASPIAPAEKLPSPSMSQVSERILIVEDADDVRALVAHILKQAGYQVTAVGGSNEALEIISRLDAPLDLVITDVVLPQLDGIQFAERVRVRFPDAKVLFVSGYAVGPPLERAMQRLSAGFLQKPFGPSELTRVVGQLLGSVAPVITLGAAQGEDIR